MGHKILFTYSQRTTIKYGVLYNAYAFVNTNGLTSTGWHIPTDTDIDTLISYLGGTTVTGGKLKESGFTYWNSPNTGADNSSKFNARAVGVRYASGASFDLQGQQMFIRYKTTVFDRSVAILYYNSAIIAKYDSLYDARYGCSVRIVKDSTSLSHGEEGTYTGNDGKIYRTICIGTQEWLADNLAETKYNDGTLITEVTDATAWEGLSTEGMCAYNNDWDNV